MKEAPTPLTQLEFKLKQPLLIYVLAAAFLLAPFGNVALSMHAIGVEDWYSFRALWEGLKNAPASDQAWLGLEFIVGFLLLRPRKLSWALAIFTLLLSFGFNIYNGFILNTGNFFAWGALFSSVAIGIIIFYFRFPYLDRREGWWGVSARLPANRPASLVVGSNIVHGLITNVSRTGVFFRPTPASTTLPSVKEGDVMQLKIEPSDYDVRLERMTPDGLGLRFFQNLTPNALQQMTSH